MSILNIKNLSLSFKIKNSYYQALHDINLSIDKGKTLAIVGESGCGKTITAMSVLRLLPSNAQIISGEILYNNKNLLEFSQKQIQKVRGKEIAYIPQDPMTSLNPLYTIGNQIIEIINIHRNLYGSDAEKLAINVLEQVKIPNAKDRLKSYPHEFSGGMRQRVIIAMAIATQAPLIIADEPTTALDVTVQAQIMNLLKDIRSEYQTSIILISHNLALVSQYADDIAVMYAGSVVEESSTESLFSSPKHPYTQSLLKALPDLNTSILVPIVGQPPSIKESFDGCPFEPRCSNKLSICSATEPKNFIINNSKVKCHLFNSKC